MLEILQGELVGVDDTIPSIILGKHFIDTQGYSVTNNIMYQENKLTILLGTNGQTSSSCNTEHIYCQYFAIKDLVDHGEMSIEHCPTDKMWADMLTEVLSGKTLHGDMGGANVYGCRI